MSRPGAVSLIKIIPISEREVLQGTTNRVRARPAILFEFESRYTPTRTRDRRILSLLPKYEIFCLNPSLAEMRRSKSTM